MNVLLSYIFLYFHINVHVALYNQVVLIFDLTRRIGLGRVGLKTRPEAKSKLDI